MKSKPLSNATVANKVEEKVTANIEILFAGR
jgi:hypothetical protein